MFRYFLICLILCSNLAFSLDFKVQKNLDAPFVLKSKNIGGREYLSIKEIQKKIFKSGKVLNGNTIVDKELKILLSASSFYVSAEKSNVSEIAQLSAPVIVSDGEVFAPAYSFLNVLEALRVYEIQIADNEIKIISIQENVPEEIPTVITQENVLPKLNSSKTKIVESKASAPEHKEAKADLKENKIEQDSVKSGELYSLPKNLIRKEVKNKVEQSESINELYYYESPSIAATEDFALAEHSTIENIYVKKNRNNSEIRIKSHNDIDKFYPAALNGLKITITLPNSILSKSFSPNSILPVAPVKKITVSKSNSALILTVSLSSKVLKSTVKRINSSEIAYVLTYNAPAKGDDSDDIKVISNPKASSDEKKATATNKKKWNLDVICLDPGHGGKDGGAIGVTGYKEKDFTLKIAQLVKEKLSDILPSTKVILTRNNDTFIELYRRTQIANENKCKLFISIHANSMPTKPNKANGFETYILRTGRNDDAVRVADKENSVIKYEKSLSKYKELDPEQLIIATMAQASFVKFSEKFAGILQKQAPAKTGLFNRGVNQAGFFVLVGASMPNALIESGFLSNAKEEKYLKSTEGQEKIAESIAQAIKKYADAYKEMMDK